MKEGYRRKPNGAFEYRFTYMGERCSVSGATEKICEEKAEVKRREIYSGLQKNAKSITFKDFAAEWIETEKCDCKAATRHSYEKKVKALSDFFKDKKIINISRRDVLSLRKHLAENYASSTGNYYLSLMRSIMNSAVANDMILKSPCIDISPIAEDPDEVKITETSHRALSKTEQEVFFRYAKNTHYYHLFAFMVSTGVRIGEAGALTWNDIDTKDKVIHIRKTVTQPEPKIWIVGPPKTKAAKRDLALTDSINNVLVALKNYNISIYGIASVKNDRQLFYPETREGLVQSSLITHAIDAVLKKLNEDKKNPDKIEHFSTHAFRHTFATRCIQQGMQPNTLKKILGHTKIAQTMDLYAHVQAEDISSAMNRLDISV